MLPQYIAVIECETGALYTRVTFAVSDLGKAATRALDYAQRDARRNGRNVSMRIFEQRAATLGEICAHFRRLENVGAISFAERVERCNTWARRFAALEA